MYHHLTKQETIDTQNSLEGTVLHANVHVGKAMAVFTSGGDSQGMNAAVRSVVRTGLYLGCNVYLIHEGYQGMIDGGSNIVAAEWSSVSDIIQRGGTVIGSARCKDFMTREGRLKAVLNLIQRGISNLVCIGGDGSLTGANKFRQEWPGLVTELVSQGKLTEELGKSHDNVQIVGLVGSIDNDFSGTDMTIGTDSGLHRIIEAVDAVVSTAQSHQRCFVIEVMGRHCGYLGLVAGLATEADWVFIPEWPSPGNWKDEMCERLRRRRSLGSRVNIVIVSEGAIDKDGNPISSDMVKDVIKTELHYDTRVTVLGHVQRGGNPSAFDRLLGCRSGCEAVVALLEMTPEKEPCVISTRGNQIVRVPLMQCVAKTHSVQKAMEEKKWAIAVAQRGPSFTRNLEAYKLLSKLDTPAVDKENLAGGFVFNLAVMNVGAPACGMNAAVRSFIRVGLYHRCNVFAIENSFQGLANGEIKAFKWQDVNNWVMHGGSFLGTQKQLPSSDNMDKIANQLKKFEIHALLLIGGFEAYHSALIMTNNRTKYRAFCIPMIVIPATISNNIPGASYSIGSDTAMNEICSIIDKIKLSAMGTKKRVFIVETMGGYCGYLATVCALASGADNAYIFEDKITLEMLKEDVDVIAEKMVGSTQRYLVLRNENASANYTTHFIEQLFREEGKGQFTTRVNVLGHFQQGGSPSPYDRNQATKLSLKATHHLISQARQIKETTGLVYTTAPETSTLLGTIDRQVGVFTPVQLLAEQTDFEHRLPVEQWWLKLRPLMRLLAKHSGIKLEHT